MSADDEPARTAEAGPSFWRILREFLHAKAPITLKESIEEAIEEHAGDGADPGDLDSDERLMLRNMLHLTEQKARDVAVQRSDIIAVSDEWDFPQLVHAFQDAGHSRLPVYHRSLDEVTGMLHVKDIYTVIAEHFGRPSSEGGPWPTVAQLLRPVLFAPPSMPLVDLLTEMRRRRTHMAILVDEFGGTDGLLSIEDIVEEIVGEIEDEHDEDEPALLHRSADGGIEADARIELDELQRELGADFVDTELGYEVETLGGLAVLLAGRVPAVGESFLHPNGWTLEVLAGDGRRIERLRLLPPAGGAGAAIGHEE